MTVEARRSKALGAVLDKSGKCHFCVWAPNAKQVALVFEPPDGRTVPMKRDAEGYHTAAIDGVQPGTRYWYQLGDLKRPDPASRSQPDGLHGPSEVVSNAFEWTDSQWRGIPLADYIFYELHVGTFTPEGTFDAIIPHLDSLVALGISAVEIMPVAQFPGTRNWGYDGAALYAVQNSYGGAQAFKRLIDACHARGLAVVLDVVYNHFGPEGNYLNDFGPYSNDHYRIPWGNALNFDGPQSDHVRRFFIENALMWIDEFHVDGLRLDATHALLDFSAHPILELLASVVHERRNHLKRDIFLIAENDRSDDRLLRPAEAGGVGIDAQWSDELHHTLHTILTGESFGYYQDYGHFSQVVQAFRHGYVYAGEYSPFRGRHHGTFRVDLPAKRFVVCTQNHDQVGNRMKGDRLSQLVSFEALKLAAGLVLLSPYLPLLFMGEEYGETNPFQFFTSFEDPELQKAVSKGRAKEFEAYNWEGDVPDPQAEETYTASKLNYGLRDQGHHRLLLAFYTELVRLRKTLPALRNLDKTRMEVTGFERQRVLFARRWHVQSDVCLLFNFADTPSEVIAPIPDGRWTCVLSSADARWQADEAAAPFEMPVIDSQSSGAISLPPLSCTVYMKQEIDEQ
jgi:maltooligosyltrehalose trehalohydrolase